MADTIKLKTAIEKFENFKKLIGKDSMNQDYSEILKAIRRGEKIP